jgi:hypothetical protein
MKRKETQERVTAPSSTWYQGLHLEGHLSLELYWTQETTDSVQFVSAVHGSQSKDIRISSS